MKRWSDERPGDRIGFVTGTEGLEELMPAASVPGPERWGSCHEARLEGFAGIAELPNLTRALVPRGYVDAEIPGIIGGNWLRFFEPFRDGGQ